MATVKANAHFVDCDIDKDNLVGDWTWTQTAVAGTNTAYVNADVGKIAFSSGTPTTLDADGAATDEGDGIVSLPSEGHGFTAGLRVQFFGTVNYDNDLDVVLTSGTTKDRLFFAGGYTAETFSGNEIVQRIITNAAITGFTDVDYDNDNNLYATILKKVATPTCLIKYDYDDGVFTWNGDYTYFTPAGDDWGANDVGYRVELSPDRDAIYVSSYDGAQRGALRKFSLDGTGIWTISDIQLGAAYTFRVTEDYVYLNMSSIGVAALHRYNASDGSLDKTYSSLKGHQDVDVDESSDIIVNCSLGTIGGGPPNYENLFVSNLAETATASINVDVAGNFFHDVFRVHIHNGDIYAMGEDDSSGNNVWRFDTSLNKLNSTFVENAYTGILFTDDDGQLVVMTDRELPSTGKKDNYVVLSDDLQTQTSVFNLGVRVAFVVLDGRSGSNYTLNYKAKFFTTNQQDRTVAYPLDYSHLEGEEVQVLGDGEYLDDTTYTISSGAVSPALTTTTNHVGLQVVSKVQPMKIDGESQIKRIRKIIPDVFESVGGEYGREEDDLYSMQLDASNDPMDQDGDLKTGYVELPFDGEYDRQADIWIKQDIPLPMHVLGLGVKLSKERGGNVS
jgi:hypothetical protein